MVITDDLVLGTSLYDDQAAELHEDASARLREHVPSTGVARSCAIARSAFGLSGYQDPAGGLRGTLWPITESDRCGKLRGGSDPCRIRCSG